KSMAEIDKLKKAVAEGMNPRDAKVALAKEIVERFHSKEDAEAALQDFINRTHGGIPDDIPTVKLTGAPLTIGNLLKQAGLCPSTSDAMRMVQQGAVRINSEVVRDKALKVGVGEMVVQVGKRRFAKVELA
ncbi:MAG: RNA-binding S4 domain-containing protein, partial [Oxalobacter sp.]|nr:RNA-binding S4 domain-containing protein [Oxalobacter sp.]